MQTVDDRALMSRLAAGEMAPLGELYKKHCTTVKRATRRFAPTLTEAEIDEVTQDVFLKLRESAARFPDGVSLRTWLYGIAANTARNAGRLVWLRRKLLGKAGLQHAGMARPADVTFSERVESREILERALSELPRGQRQVLLLHAVDGFNGEEIAEILGLRLGTVWTRLHRARTRLQKRLKALSFDSRPQDGPLLFCRRDP